MTLRDEIKQGEELADAAEATRQDLRWNVQPGTPEREQLIADTLDEIDVAMKPIRSAVGRLAWHDFSERTAERLRAVSARLQYERRQLKKMRR